MGAHPDTELHSGAIWWVFRKPGKIREWGGRGCELWGVLPVKGAGFNRKYWVFPKDCECNRVRKNRREMEGWEQPPGDTRLLKLFKRIFWLQQQFKCPRKGWSGSLFLPGACGAGAGLGSCCPPPAHPAAEGARASPRKPLFFLSHLRQRVLLPAVSISCFRCENRGQRGGGGWRGAGCARAKAGPGCPGTGAGCAGCGGGSKRSLVPWGMQSEGLSA